MILHMRFLFNLVTLFMTLVLVRFRGNFSAMKFREDFDDFFGLPKIET